MKGESFEHRETNEKFLRQSSQKIAVQTQLNNFGFIG